MKARISDHIGSVEEIVQLTEWSTISSEAEAPKPKLRPKKEGTVNPKPKKRWWRIILASFILFAKIAQFLTVGPMEMTPGATSGYITGAVVGDLLMLALIIWLFRSGMKPARPKLIDSN